jgi:hypothetical protein
MARFKEFLARALERNKPFLLSILDRARGSIANLLNDTELLTDLAEGLHGQAPFWARWFVRRKAFVRFVISNRDKISPLLTSAAAQGSALPSSADASSRV